MKNQAHPRQFPTKLRIRELGRLRFGISYGYPGRNGIGFTFCWNPKPQHDVTASWTGGTGVTYRVTWEQVAEIIARAEAKP